MIEIDWSKAPQGATHYNPLSARFFRQDSYAYRWDDSQWTLLSLSDLGEYPWAAQLIERPSSPAWKGEGLPPVGAFIVNAGDYKGKSEVILHRHGQALVEQEDGVAADYVLFGKSECRLAPTPEQIAAEEREKAIQEMISAIHGGVVQCAIVNGAYKYIKDACKDLYDSGYRKVEG